VRAITISRTKAVVQLPPRIDEIHHLNFTEAEQDMYEAAKTRSRMLLEEAISSGNQNGKTFNALRLLNILRLICNHGLLTNLIMESKTWVSQREEGRLSPREAPNVVYSSLLDGATCSDCGADLLDDILEGSVTSGMEPRRTSSSCDPIICERCISQRSDDSIDQSSFERHGQETSESLPPAIPGIDSDTAITTDSMSSKINALVADLYKHKNAEKRYPSISIHDSAFSKY
jgi:SNF2 family DNA or RNA helicase